MLWTKVKDAADERTWSATVAAQVVGSLLADYGLYGAAAAHVAGDLVQRTLPQGATGNWQGIRQAVIAAAAALRPLMSRESLDVLAEAVAGAHRARAGKWDQAARVGWSLDVELYALHPEGRRKVPTAELLAVIRSVSALPDFLDPCLARSAQ